MASSSRETPTHQQHISGLTVTDGARLFAGTNTTIYNGWYTLSKILNNCAINASFRPSQSATSSYQDKTMYVSARYRFHLFFSKSLEVAEEQTPSYYEVPNRRVDGFVGREDVLQKIDKVLSDGSGPHYAVLQGIGGQGKSQVALEYCRRKKDNPYSAIFWLDATTQDRVERSFHSISKRIKRRTDYLPDVNARVAFVLKMFTSWTVQ